MCPKHQFCCREPLKMDSTNFPYPKTLLFACLIIPHHILHFQITILILLLTNMFQLCLLAVLFLLNQKILLFFMICPIIIHPFNAILLLLLVVILLNPIKINYLCLIYDTIYQVTLILGFSLVFKGVSLPYGTVNDKHFCSTCQFGKLSQNTFPPFISKTSTPFELIHSYIWLQILGLQILHTLHK